MSAIPRIIHRVWLGGPEPADLAANAETWQRHNPGWEVWNWDHDDVVDMGLANWELYTHADRIATGSDVWRMRSDIARVEILARYGGVYVDADFEALAPLEPLLDGVTCFAVEEKPGLIANGIMGATKGHPAIVAYADTLGAVPAAPTRRRVWQLTGPGMLTDVWRGRDDVTLLPTLLFYPYHHRDLVSVGALRIGADAVAHHTWSSARRRATVIVPWRDNGCEHRAAAKALVLAGLAEHRDWQVIETTDDGAGAWSKAQAIREGIRLAAGDVLAVIDADLILPGLAESIDAVRRGVSRWAMPFDNLYRLDEESTARVLAGEPPAVDMPTDEKVYPGVVGGGAVVVDRALAEECPPDPRFRGWGGEDVAWGKALFTLGGALTRADAPCFHLWHPPQERLSRSVGNPRNHALYEHYAAIAKAKDRRAMLALIAEANAGTPWEAPDPPPLSPSGWWRWPDTGRLRYSPAKSLAARGWVPLNDAPTGAA